MRRLEPDDVTELHSTHWMSGKSALVAIRIMSTIHQIPHPPIVMSFTMPSPTWPMMNLSTPSWPKSIDITSVSTQLTFLFAMLLPTLACYLKVCCVCQGRVWLSFLLLLLFLGLVRNRVVCL